MRLRVSRRLGRQLLKVIGTEPILGREVDVARSGFSNSQPGIKRILRTIDANQPQRVVALRPAGVCRPDRPMSGNAFTGKNPLTAPTPAIRMNLRTVMPARIDPERRDPQDATVAGHELAKPERIQLPP